MYGVENKKQISSSIALIFSAVQSQERSRLPTFVQNAPKSPLPLSPPYDCPMSSSISASAISNVLASASAALPCPTGACMGSAPAPIRAATLPAAPAVGPRGLNSLRAGEGAASSKPSEYTLSPLGLCAAAAPPAVAPPPAAAAAAAAAASPEPAALRASGDGVETEENTGKLATNPVRSGGGERAALSMDSCRPPLPPTGAPTAPLAAPVASSTEPAALLPMLLLFMLLAVPPMPPLNAPSTARGGEGGGEAPLPLLLPLLPAAAPPCPPAAAPSAEP